ncbi:MAG: hypothetical protein ACRCYO_17435 [Bacteroidia bacterium]
MNCYLYKIEREEKVLSLLSPLAQSELPVSGLSNKAIIGSLLEPLHGVVPNNIAYNPDFLIALHELVRDLMVNDADVLKQASEQDNGFVFIVDRRAPEGNDIPKHDIIGIFLVNDKQTDVARYRPNPDYQLISEKGMGQFPNVVEEKLMHLLMQA